jgi:glucose uptake protein GlcU
MLGGQDRNDEPAKWEVYMRNCLVGTFELLVGLILVGWFLTWPSNIQIIFGIVSLVIVVGLAIAVKVSSGGSSSDDNYDDHHETGCS